MKVYIIGIPEPKNVTILVVTSQHPGARGVDPTHIFQIGGSTITWMSQEVSQWLGSVGYSPNIPHL